MISLSDLARTTFYLSFMSYYMFYLFNKLIAAIYLILLEYIYILFTTVSLRD